MFLSSLFLDTTMALKFVAIGLGLLQLAVGLPTNKANTLEDLLMVDDTISVGSFVRETRAAAVSIYYCHCQVAVNGVITRCAICFIHTWNIKKYLIR